MTKAAPHPVGRPTKATKKCDDLEVHEEHYHGKGAFEKYCPGLKHRSKRRGLPRPPRRDSRNATNGGESANGKVSD
jgi:hypothetical protein